jgi:ribonuclease HII
MLLIDGNRFIALLRHRPHLRDQGDGRFRSIAAASVLAKTHRDALMQALHAAHPALRLGGEQGLPHGGPPPAIAAHGPTVWHPPQLRRCCPRRAGSSNTTVCKRHQQWRGARAA